MAQKIVVRFNGMVLETFSLEAGEYEIGRGPENDIDINHPSVHRRHGKISFINKSWIYQDHTTQKLQTLDNVEPVFVSSEIDIATEEYTLSEQTGDRSLPAFINPRYKKSLLSLAAVLVALVGIALIYVYLKNRGRHSDPNQLLADVRSKVVEFEKIKDLEAIEDYKKYGGFSDADFRENMGYCTGFLVARDVVLTASHCLWGSDLLDLQTSFEIRMFDGKKLKPLRVLGFDPVRDYLFLEVPGVEAYGHLEFADDYKIGQTVYTLGNAHGQGIAIREGIMANETPDLNDPTIKYIRYSAGASPGNSGGPLLDSYGKIVALVFAATGAENYNLGTSCHDLKTGFEKFVDNREEKKIAVKVKKLFNFNLHSFLQKQILPFLSDYSEYPEVNQLVDQMELEFTAPIPFENLGPTLLTEINNKSNAALAEVEKTLLAQKQVILDWASFVSEKTPAILPSQFDNSQNIFYKHNGRYYMKTAGFLDSPNRKDFKGYLEQFDKEKKFDFQAYGMNMELINSTLSQGPIQYVVRNPTKNKLSFDDMAQGSLYSQMILGKKITDEDLIPLFLKNFFGDEGALSGTYSAFIRPQSYKTFTIKALDKKMMQEKVKDGLGRQWNRWSFRVFDQIYFYIYCMPVPEGVQCASRIFPLENKDRREIVEANFRQHILGHFLENPYFWQPEALTLFMQSPEREGLTSLRGIELKDTDGSYKVELKEFKLQFNIPLGVQSIRLQTGFWLAKDNQPQWTGYGAEWIVGGKNPQLCGLMVEPIGTQSIYVLNFLRDTLKRLKLKDDGPKEEIPRLWTQKVKLPEGKDGQLVGYCAPFRENPIEEGAYFVDFKRAKPFTAKYKALK